MEDYIITKRKIGGGDMAEEEQSWPKKPTLVKPLPLRAQPNLPFGAGSSSFQPWRRPYGDISNGRGINAGITLTSTNINKPSHRLATSYNSTLVEDGNDLNIQNSTEKYPIINDIIGPTSGDDANSDDDNTDITDDDEVKEDQPSSGCNTNSSEMDPKKLRRIMSNRLSAQRSREKRNAYVADLENKAKAFQEKIELIHPQIAAQKTKVQLLQIEQHRLKLLMAAREKQRILQEVAFEKNRSEADRLRKLHMKLTAEARARMLNMGAALRFRSNSNLCPSGLGRFVCNNSPQATINGVETSITEVDTVQQLQNQGEMMMMMPTRDNILIKSAPNLNLVKSEPES